MKILFYLPVVTPWWFRAIITPMLRALYADAELHVMVAPLWRGTGIEGEHLEPLADLPSIHWHVIEGDGPADFRTDGVHVDGLIDLIHDLSPDLTLVRSADFATPPHFPGTVRYIMEGAAAPFVTDPRWVVLEERPFAMGIMPPRAPEIGERCAAMLDDSWRVAAATLDAARLDARTLLDLPRERPVVALPLQYEHEENFFLAHAAFPDSIALIAHLLKHSDPGVTFAITDHPLNRVHLDRSALHTLIAEHDERLMFFDAANATETLAACSDAVLVDMSKCWSIAAFCGTPLIAPGRAPVAKWLNAARSIDAAQRPLAHHALGRPCTENARRWFGWHLGARIIDPTRVTIDQLLGCVAGTADEGTIAANIEAVLALQGAPA